MRIALDQIGFAPEQTLVEQQYDARTTRMFTGTGTSFIPVPGLQHVDGVRMRGIRLQKEIEMDLPIDPSLTNFLSITAPCYRVIRGVDGTPLLQRSEFSNDGIWQKGAEVYVTGEWDETVSPASGEPLVPPEAIHRPVVTESGVPEDVAGARGRGRAQPAAKE